MRTDAIRCAVGVLTYGLALVTPIWAHSAPRTVGFTRAVFRMEEGATWGHISGGANCETDYERLQWGRSNSDVQTGRLATAFEQAVASVTPSRKDENLFDTAPAATDLQVAAAISEMRANLCEKRGLVGNSGSLSMTVAWQVYDPTAGQIVGRFETHTTGQSGQSSVGGIDDLFFAAFRENARDLMNDSGFQRLLKAPPAAHPAERPATEAVNYTPATPGTSMTLPNAAQAVVLVATNEGHGSGFLISQDGYVLTNQHVVGSAHSVRVRWADGTEAPGEVVRVDAKRDVALVKTTAAARLPLSLRVALPSQGDPVFAVGAPLDPGLQGTMTRGIVSANRIVKDQPFIQSDVIINRGNSGGPLLNERGEVVGMTVSGLLVGDVQLGYNMFIPIGDAVRALSLQPKTPKPVDAVLSPTATRRISKR